MTRDKMIKQLYLYAMNEAKNSTEALFFQQCLISFLAPEVCRYKLMWTDLITGFCQRRPQDFINFYLKWDVFCEEESHGNIRYMKAPNNKVLVDMCFFQDNKYSWHTIAVGQI